MIERSYQLHGYPGKVQYTTDGAFVSAPAYDPRSIYAFYADSGASTHMSDQEQFFFENLKPIKAGKRLVSG